MTERQILLDTINVGWSEERRFSQRSAAFGTFTLKQMPSAGAVEQDLAGTSYLEPFGHGLPGFNAFGASHRCSPCLILYPVLRLLAIPARRTSQGDDFGHI